MTIIIIVLNGKNSKETTLSNRCFDAIIEPLHVSIIKGCTETTEFVILNNLH